MRVNEIESCDTAFLTCKTSGGTKVFFVTSHAVPSTIDPITCIELDRAIIVGSSERGVLLRADDGSEHRYPAPDNTTRQKLLGAIQAVTTDREPFCTISDTILQVRVVCGAHDSCPVAEIPRDPWCRPDRRPHDGGMEHVPWAMGLRAAMIKSVTKPHCPRRSALTSGRVASPSI